MGAVSVQYATSDDTALKNLDYISKSGRLDFGDAVTNATILIPIVNDSAAEPDEIFTVRLFNPSVGARLGTFTNATVKIIDNDYLPGRLNFSTAFFMVDEGNTVVLISVARTGGSLGSISIQYSTIVGGTATPGEDYTDVTNTLTWNSGDISVKTFTIPILDDSLVENPETVLLRLQNPILNGSPSSSILGSVTNAILTIKDDDAYGDFGFSAAHYFANENSLGTVVTIVRSHGIAGSVSLNFLLTNGASVTSTLLSFAPGDRTKTVVIPIVDNANLNPNLILRLGLANPSPAGAVLSRATADLTIFDDESLNEPSGSNDTAFDLGNGLNDFVYALAFQPDGKILVAGDFTTANAVPRNHIARLNADGKTDTKFSSTSLTAGANDSVRSVVVQTDGRVLIGGLFTSANASPRNHIARLNRDGTVDTTFSPGSGSDGFIYAVAETFVGDSAVGANRKLLAVGNFTSFSATPRNGIVRLNENGAVDSTFNPETGVNGTNGTIYCVAVQSDGKVVIGGDFLSFDNLSYRHIARLNVDGTLDSTFDAGIGPDQSVRALAIQLDGKIVIGGLFENVNGVALNHIARLGVNGAVDNTFTPGVGLNDSVGAIALQTDGKIVVGGEFTRATGVNRNRITRLNPNGSVDPSINFGTGANSFVAALGVQPDGNIVLGGGFTEFDGVSRLHLARIYGRSISGSGKIEFSSAQYEVNENGTNALITVRRFGGTLADVTTHVATSDGTAVAGVDYTSVSIDLVFAAGESVQTFVVPIINNDFIEEDKTVNLTLSGTSGQLGNQTTATLIIRNDDGGISFSSPNYRFAENSPSGTALINIIRTGSSIGAASVDFVTTTNGTAVPAIDFVLVTNTVFFADGESNKVVYIPLVNDALIEGDETVTLVLTNVTGAILRAPGTATLVIVDDDSGQGNFMFSQTNYTVGEAAGSATITVIRTNGSLGFVSVDFSAGGGTASPGSDYAPTNGTLVFGDGEISKAFSVRIIDDTIPEGNEGIILTLSNPTGGAAIVGTNTVPLAIVDNDVAFSFSTPAYVANEGDGEVTITVRRENGSNGVASVSYRTRDGSATDGFDYVGTSNTLVFANGETFKTFNVHVLEDSLVEGDEFFLVTLFGPSSGTQLINPTNAVVTITDNDSSLSFSAAEYTVNEGGTNVTVRVVRTNSSSGTVSVNFATSNATAIASSDFVGTNLTLVFLPGETAKAVTIPIIDDLLTEGDETFTVRLTNPSAGTALGNPAFATVTIVDNDAGLRFSSSTYRVSESGVNATITVLRTTVTNTTVSVNYRTSDGTAREGLDYVNASGVLTFTNGETAKTFVVPVIDDTSIEGDETVLINLFLPSGQATITSPGAAVLTIVDNDGSLVVPAGSALESESIPNGVIDPGENVSLYFSFRNTVGADTTNLVGTLLPTGGVTSPSGPQNYGVLRVSGDSVPRLFSFTAAGTNGQRLTATFQLRDGTLDLGTGSFTYTLGRTATGFTNSTPITINDSPNPSTPYPSTINVSGVIGTVSKVSVTVSNLNHSFADDIDMLLVSPTGEKIILMSDAGGGNSINNATITFDDTAGTSLPDSGLISSGTFRPTDYTSQPGDFFPPPAPSGPYPSSLSALNGANPNGTWSLYVVDDTFFNSGNIAQGWTLALDAASALAPVADLSVTMTDAPDPAATNNNLTYTVTVRNNGPSAATAIVVTDLLPPGATFVSDTCGCFTQTGNTLVGNLNSLPRGGVTTFNIVVNPTATGSITNSISVSSSTVDPNLLNNVATAETTINVPRADMAISMSGSPNPVQINNNLTYSLVVSNLGPVSATGVLVTNQLPPGTTFLSANTSQGSQSLSGNNLVFNIGTLAPANRVTISIVVRPTVVGIITNVATVASSVNEPFKANNSDSVKILVQLPALILRPVNNVLSITWDTNAPGYILETATNISGNTAWLPATNYPVSVLNGKNSATINISTGARYFRLSPQGP